MKNEKNTTKSGSTKMPKLSPPTYCYARMIKSFFAGDRRISVGNPDVVGKGKNAFVSVTIKVNDAELGEALTRSLFNKIDFGGLKLLVFVVPANKKVKFCEKVLDLDSTVDDISLILKGNPAFDAMKTVFIPQFRTYSSYAIFKPTVLQYATDHR